MSKRKEGWGSLDNAAKAHYFATNGRSLCGRWVAIGDPRWESNQKKGTKPDRGTCLPCWRKAPDDQPGAALEGRDE